ncbi:MAG: DUF3772 domain-containing protein [Alcaligenaceae bacterium]|nr:DUF3772 domain-containing protein [Alcaligenaceae bacterium]
MMRIPFLVFLFAILLSIVSPLTFAAQSPAVTPEPITIEQLQAQLEAIPSTSKDNTDLQLLTSKLTKIQQNAQLLLTEVTQQVVDLDQKLSSITKPAVVAEGESTASTPTENTAEETIKADAAPETVFIAEQRSVLQKEHEKLDAQRKHLILIISEAEQKSKLLVAERRQRFKAELSLQVRSMLSPTFWSNWSLALSGDMTRIQEFKTEVSQLAKRALSPENRWPFGIGVFLSLLVFVFANRFLNRILNLVLIKVIPTGRARRSFYAISKVLFRVLAMGLVSLIFYLGLNWHEILTAEFKVYLQQIFFAILLSAFIYGLGEAILCIKRDTWRLVNLNEQEAYSLRHYPRLLTLFSLVYQFVTSTANYIETSFISEVSINSIFTLLLCLLSLSFFSRLSRGRIRLSPDNAQDAVNKEATNNTVNSSQDNSQNRPAYPIWFVSLITIGWLVALLATIITLTGYVSLGSFMVNQLVWTVLVVSGFYIAWKLADDLYQALFGAHALLGRYLIGAYNVSENLLNQFIVIVSAITKVALIYALVKVLLLPFGTNITEFSKFSNMLSTFLAENTFALTTGGIISAIVVFILGFWVIRIFKSWLETKYFPNTDLEKGVQSSISTMSGYLGGVAVIALTLGSLGLSFDKITWVASALSVGIGFGLQSIVQNFISGLILLTERPVKVGDWVVVGNDDGDIKRINIRATEIQLLDRSTLIVPNSEFITKAVRNMTLDKSEGRVQIKLPIPISTNPRLVADMILEVFEEHELVLSDMAPFIRLDSIDGSSLILSATCYVPSPRLVAQVRTELLFEILDRLHQAEINLIKPVHISQLGVGETQQAPPTKDNTDIFKV